MIGHFIMYIGIYFVQNVDLKNKRYKQFLVKNKTGAPRKKFISNLFFKLKFYLVLFIKFLNIVCLDQIQKSHIFDKKKLQSLNQAIKKKFQMSVVHLWNFFFKKYPCFYFGLLMLYVLL